MLEEDCYALFVAKIAKLLLKSFNFLGVHFNDTLEEYNGE